MVHSGMLYLLDFQAPGRAPEGRLIEIAWGAQILPLPLWQPGPYARKQPTRDEKRAVATAKDMKALAAIEVASLSAVQILQSMARQKHRAESVWIVHGNCDPRYVAQWLSNSAPPVGTVFCMGKRGVRIYESLLPNSTVRCTGYPGMGAARALRAHREKVASPSTTATCDSAPETNATSAALLEALGVSPLSEAPENEDRKAVLVLSSPGWTPRERRANSRALADAVRHIVSQGCRAVVRPKNRLDRGGLWKALGPPMHNHPLVEWAPFKTAGPLVRLLARPDIVACVGVESTGLLEAACAGLPVARVDYTARPPLLGDPDPTDTAGPFWSRWAWAPTTQAELTTSIDQLLAPTPAQLQEQEEHLSWMVSPRLHPDPFSALLAT